MTQAERKQASYALHRAAWRQNYLKADVADLRETEHSFRLQARSYALQGEVSLSAEASKWADTFASIADQQSEGATPTEATQRDLVLR